MKIQKVLTADVCQLEKKKLRSPPPEAKKSNTQPLSRTLNLARCTQRKAPSSSQQPVCMALNLEVSNKAPALPIELKQDLMDAFEIILNVFGGSALGQASMTAMQCLKAMQCLPLAWACLAIEEAGKNVKDVRDKEASRSYHEVALPGFIKLCHEAIEESDGALRFRAGWETKLAPPSEVRDARWSIADWAPSSFPPFCYSALWKGSQFV